MIDGLVCTVFPVTTNETCCADGWDGKPSEQDKLAKAYMEAQMAEVLKDQRMDS